jgi:hypothetical protein
MPALFATHAHAWSRTLPATVQTPKPVTAGVCPNGETVSEWAKRTLNFEAEPKQVQVLDHDSHRLLLCCPRQWGKSTLIAIKALHYALTNPGCEILVLSDTEDHAAIIVEKFKLYAAMLKMRGPRAHGKQYSMVLPNGSKLFAVAHNVKSGVGYTANIVIIDEAAMVDDDVIGYVWRTLSRTNGHLWMLSTPRGQTGMFAVMWHDEELPWFRVKATVEDAKYLDPSFVQEQKKLFPATFRQDFYCEFMPAPGRLLSAERIAKNVDPALNNRILYDETQEIFR